jgi:predicted NAD/FAD-binding protein
MLDGRRVAVIGSGISGMSAAWLLSRRFEVTVYEQDGRIGGHTNTVEVETPDGPLQVDTGFIVYNEENYPNLTALFEHLGVETRLSDMSFGVSLDDGALEYSSFNLQGLFAQAANIVSPRFWSMLRDIPRFYQTGLRDLLKGGLPHMSLGEYLRAGGFCRAFEEDHLLPQAAAIWSTTPGAMRDYPIAAFLRFFHNHGLMRLTARPLWRTVVGGSRAYVDRLTAAYADRIRLGRGVVGVRRGGDGVWIRDVTGHEERFDDVVIAAHADQALKLLEDPNAEERRLLGAIRYTPNRAVLHTDAAFMPRRRAAWSSWNHIGRRADPDSGGVTYWMNRLQGLPERWPLFVTLNPANEPDPAKVIKVVDYEHPLFDAAAVQAQQHLWSLQGVRRTWFCGAWFGAGFHEDGLQSGLAVAEAMGAPRRPWEVENESSRIWLTPDKVEPLRDFAR